MVTGKRRDFIRAILNEKPFVSFAELFACFPQLSNMTIRRDIEYLELHGEAVRVRGGVRGMRFVTASMEDDYDKRLTENISSKSRIALAALAYVESGRSLFFDSGTTVMSLAGCIGEQRLNVTTTAPNIALELLCKPNVITNLVGGMVNRGSISVSGTQANEYLNAINIDVAFISPSGVSPDGDFTSGNYSECELKKIVVGKARRVIMLMDASKFDHSLPYTFCSLSGVDTLITDSPLPDGFGSLAVKAGARIIIAK